MVGTGPEGPGAIYYIDTTTRFVSFLAKVPGTTLNPHGGGDTDERARDWVGKVSLGDIEYHGESDAFFVVSLENRQIHHFDGNGIYRLAFDHGAIREPWADDARPFGLGIRGDRLYHGVVNSAESTGDKADLRAVVYESAFDGTEMRQVVDLPLAGQRGFVTLPATVGVSPPFATSVIEWLPWRSGDSDVATSTMRMSLYPQPMLSDIEFDAAGNMILGFRDRRIDMGLAIQVTEPTGSIIKPSLGLGDIVRATLDPGGGPPTWSAAIRPEHFRDGLVDQDESAQGGLASLLGLDEIVSGYFKAADLSGGASHEGAHWLGTSDGTLRRQEVLCGKVEGAAVTGSPTPTPLDFTPTPSPTPLGGAPPTSESRDGLWLGPTPAARPIAPAALNAPTHSEWLPSNSIGDMEIMCGPTPTPTATPTSTITPTPTPTRPIYLPAALGETCDPTSRRADVALVIDSSTSMRRATRAGREKLAAAQDAAELFVSSLRLDLGRDGDAIAIVGFNDAAWTAHPLGHSSMAALAAIGALAERVDSGTRLDLALLEGADALRDSGRGSDRLPVLILLTDGLTNQVPTREPSGS